MPDKPAQPYTTSETGEGTPDGLSLDQIKLEPWYKDIEDEITKPDQVAVQSKYFWTRWVPLLGPGPTVLLVRLRQYCYYNRETGEKRDWCYPSQETLAREIGLRDRETLRTYLIVLEGHGFLRREAQYRYDAAKHKKVRTTDKYYVRMWDPIAPEDEGAAVVKAVERMLRDTDLTGRNPVENRVIRPMTEKPPQVIRAGDNRPPKAEKPSYGAGGKTARKSDLEDVLKTFNVASQTRETVLRTSHLSEDILEQLGDAHSLPFYRKVARTLPDQAIYALLSEVKDARLTDRLTSTPGAYFTFLAKLKARELGLEL